MLARLLAFLRGLYAIIRGLLSQDDPLVKGLRGGYIPSETLTRLRGPCGTGAYGELNAPSSIRGGMRCVR
ncbi:MAG: hypothetical protein ACP5QG_02275 [candidate division WOR-3 bacterium]